MTCLICIHCSLQSIGKSTTKPSVQVMPFISTDHATILMLQLFSTIILKSVSFERGSVIRSKQLFLRTSMNRYTVLCIKIACSAQLWHYYNKAEAIDTDCRCR